MAAISDNAGAYEARTADERHLDALMEQLPAMQEVQGRLERHRAAVRLCEKFRGVDDLGCAIDEIEAQGPLNTPEARQLYDVLLAEKRAAYRDEKARLDSDVARSQFATVVEASAACLAPEEVRSLEEELNRFRDDYALTLAKCQGAA